tara:strand:+ start:249 stop:407 length:159 start_codon:yes stop_codon:yes gene_type:complete
MSNKYVMIAQIKRGGFYTTSYFNNTKAIFKFLEPHANKYDNLKIYLTDNGYL